MDFALNDRVAVVTGGSAGIGLATVEAFLAEGARVAFCARTKDAVAREAARLAERWGARVLGFACDVLDEAGIERFRDATLAQFARADILVANAGHGSRSTFAAASDAQWRDEIELKFFSVIRPTRAFLPALEQSGEGAIVVVNSLLAVQPEPHLVAMSAARGGVHSLIKGLSFEFAAKGIRVNSILVGTIATGGWQNWYEQQKKPGQSFDDWAAGEAAKRHVALARLGRPEEAAAVVLFLASKLASYITGAALEVSGGSSRHV